MSVSLGKGAHIPSSTTEAAGPQESFTPISGSIAQSTASAVITGNTRVDTTGDITQTPAVISQSVQVDVGPPPQSVTIAQLIVDAGSASEVRTVIDPTYPGANGTVDWVATDPLSGTDPGGKARWWARYPDGSGGFWRRRDWDQLTVGVGAANAISLDWATFDEDEDVSIVFQELLDQYISGPAGNTLSIKGPEDVSSISVGGLSRTGDQSISAWYWYRPTTNKCIVWTKPWSLGTEDLLAKTWTNLGSNRWSTTVTEDVNFLRACDPSIKKDANTNTSKGPWLVGMRLESSAAAVNAAREWFYDSGSNTLTVYATSDPGTYFTPGSSSSLPGMQYVTDVTDLDNHGVFTDFHKFDIEGGGSFFHSNNGLESRGRAGMEPWGGGGEVVAGGNELTKDTGWSFVYNQSGFTTSGSLASFKMGMSGYVSAALRFQTSPNNFQIIEKLVVGGVSAAQIRYALTDGSTCVQRWHHYHQEDDATGDKYRNLRLWGEHIGAWDGALSPSGATDDTGTENKGTSWVWPFQGNNRFINFRKITGHGSGANALAFVGRKDSPTIVQFGESLADPYKLELVGGTFGVHGDYNTFAPNGRPVFFDNNASFEYQYGKADTYNCVRGGTNFIWIENKGIVDAITGVMPPVVDIRDDTGTSNDVLNVAPNPGDLDLGLRSPILSFETTIPETTGWYAGMNLKISGLGQGIIVFSETDWRFPWNASGHWTIHGINDACRTRLDGVQSHTTITDFTFADMYTSSIHSPEVAVSIFGEVQHGIVQDVDIIGCTLEGNRTIQVGNVPFPGPHDVRFTNLTITGDANRDAVVVIPHGSGKFNEGHPITMVADSVAGWDSGTKVSIPGGENGDNVWFSDDGGTTHYKLPYEVGGTNVTKSAPPDLLRKAFAWRTYSGTGVNVWAPQFFRDGNLCIAVIWFNGDPGTFTELSGFSPISGASANLSDNSLYVRAFQRVYATGTDAWDESLITANSRSAQQISFNWTNSVSGFAYTVEYAGQNASPIGDANSNAHNIASTTHIAPTLTTTTDSMILALIGVAGNAGQTTDFGGSLSPWMAAIISENQGGGAPFGREGTGDNFQNEPNNVGCGFAAADLYAGTGGSKAGCTFTEDASVKAITTSIEIKT